MKLEEAKKIAEEVFGELTEQCDKVIVVGSIRRKCAEVHDIDIVVIPKKPNLFDGHGRIFSGGKKIIKFERSGIQVEIYVADEKTYEVLKLIRTGSKEHNIKLCRIARNQGYMLKADGTGLCWLDGKVIDNTEAGILNKLLGRYVEPEGRK